MFEAIQSYIPLEWRRTVEFLGAPLWWIPEWQSIVLNFSLFGVGPVDAALRRVFLLLPVLVVVVGMWATMTALYTIPFRGQRGRFATALAMSWWDAGRSIWFFWAGVLRLLFVAVGWVWGLLKLGVRLVGQAIRTAFTSPFMLLDWTSRRYFKPGVPWIAFLLTLGWSALEATIFTYTLLPTVVGALDSITGFSSNRTIVAPILWAMLFGLIAGSFACIQVLGAAVRDRHVGRIAQMAFVELSVMFFEVFFLYRELIDAVTPWIAQQTGAQLGFVSTLSLAGFGWIGVRGMTWFLFGRYGTPALIAVLSRETLSREGAVEELPEPPARVTAFREAVDALKAEMQWFKAEARSLFELLSLPILQLFAAAVNFPVVVVRSRPAFQLPFRKLDEVLAQTPGADLAGGAGGVAVRRATSSRRRARPDESGEAMASVGREEGA